MAKVQSLGTGTHKLGRKLTARRQIRRANKSLRKQLKAKAAAQQHQQRDAGGGAAAAAKPSPTTPALPVSDRALPATFKGSLLK
jgi:hypothetical protein